MASCGSAGATRTLRWDERHDPLEPMIALQVTSTDARLHDQNCLTVGGTSATLRWDDGGEWPGHGHAAVTQLDWALPVGENPFDQYVEGMESLRRPLSKGVTEHRDRLHAAPGYVLKWEPGQCSLFLAWPDDPALTSMLVAAVAGGMSMAIRANGVFADRTGAPAPTSEAFEAGAPAFVLSPPDFQPFQRKQHS